MKTLVIYDSVFGNTQKVAEAIGRALDAPVQSVKNTSAGQLAGLQLLIVGSPTRQFNATPETMAFLKGLPVGALQGVKAAAFDTRIAGNTIKFFFFRWLVQSNYADKKIAAELARVGASLAGQEGFLVKESEGPLAEGELERAAAWASQLAGGSA